jgi:proteasome beta subunit
VTTNEARETARAAVAAASERDTASGNGVTVATITSDGVRVTSDGEGADSDGDAGEGVA